MEHLPRKRKASQSSPVQEHRCVPQDDVPHDAASTPAVVDISNDAAAHRPKRPRLSLDSPPDSLASNPTPRPPPKRESPRPSAPPHHELPQYLLHGPATHGSLLSPLESPASSSPVVPTPQRFFAPIRPTITRDTLRELELESILKNPQLRHDLLFDPGLQFRPTPSRRKQLTSERYWIAIKHEISFGCTCASWIPTVVPNRKRFRPPTPPPWSEPHFRAYLADYELPCSALTSKKEPEPPQNPYRLLYMLQELVAVLRSVIVPACVSPPPPQLQLYAPTCATRPAAPSASSAEHILSQIDPMLMAQELRRRMFDPAGLFALIGETLKRHCAPMRDRQVDAMINIAKASEGTNPTDKAVCTFRMCFEILELMKLDIANHQLQHLRPFLAATTPDFELQVFITRCRQGVTSLRSVRVWLQNAWDRVSICYTKAAPAATVQTCTVGIKEETDMDTGPAPSAPATTPFFSTLSPLRRKVYLSLIEGITGLVFNPLPPSRLPGSPAAFGFPETLYLDTARVTVLAADAADLTALYMLLMLWRQLVFWTPASGGSGSVEVENNQNSQSDVFSPYSRDTPRLEDWEVDRMKREIWEVGPRRIGSCFLFSGGKDGADDVGEERAKWKNAMQNVELQIAMRAEEARTRSSSMEGAALESSPSSSQRTTTAAATATTLPPPLPTTATAAATNTTSLTTPQPSSSPTTRRPPSQSALALTHGWLETNMRRDSLLARRFRALLWREVVRVVVRLTFSAVKGGVNPVGVGGGINLGGVSVGGVAVPGGVGVMVAPKVEDAARARAQAQAQAQAQAAARAAAQATAPVSAPPRAPFIPHSGGGTAAGLEPLMPEIRHLAQRIAKLVLVNMQVYWSLYEADGFLVDRVVKKEGGGGGG